MFFVPSDIYIHIPFDGYNAGLSVIHTISVKLPNKSFCHSVIPILNNSLGQSIKGRILGRAKIVSIVGPDIRLIAPDKKPAGTT